MRRPTACWNRWPGKDGAFHGDGFIDLDCLCGYAEYPAGRLGCLRLEDMAEFYC